MAYFQYPWRFLTLASLTVSFLGGSVMILPRTTMVRGLPKAKMLSLFLGAGAVVVIVFTNAKLFTPQYINSAKSADFTSPLSLNWQTSKISDEYMPKNFTKPQSPNDIPTSKFTPENNQTKITMLQETAQQFSAKIESVQNSSVIINLAYFPAWHAYLDNSEIPYIVFNKGLKVNLPQGEHLLAVKFIETPIEKLANILTIAGVIALFIGIITHILVKYAKKTT
jgi:hypothetical protein